MDIVKKILVHCGHSPDLVQIVTGYGDTGAALVNSGVDKLTFIGSPGVGKLVMRAAADTLTPVLLELGGKDAAIVCEDCDFEQVSMLCGRMCSTSALSRSWAWPCAAHSKTVARTVLDSSV